MQNQAGAKYLARERQEAHQAIEPPEDKPIIPATGPLFQRAHSYGVNHWMPEDLIALAELAGCTMQEFISKYA